MSELQVCVPIDPAEVWNFDPEAVPTIQQLLKELGLKPESKARVAETAKWEQTSLAACMHFFNRRFLQPLVSDSQQALNEKARQAAAKPTLAW